MSQQAGFIKIWRQIYDCWMWTAKPFDELHAWIWLIAHANYKTETRMFRGRSVTIKRGQLITSAAALSEEWGWSRGKVFRFLDTLKKADMAKSSGTKAGTIITIKNYEKWQGERNTGGTTLGTTDGTTSGIEISTISGNRRYTGGTTLGTTGGTHLKNIRNKETPTGAGEEIDPRVKAWEDLKAAERKAREEAAR